MEYGSRKPETLHISKPCWYVCIYIHIHMYPHYTYLYIYIYRERPTDSQTYCECQGLPQFPIMFALGGATPKKHRTLKREKKNPRNLCQRDSFAFLPTCFTRWKAFGTFGSDASLLITLWIVHGWCRCSGIHGRPRHGAVCSMASTWHLVTWKQKWLMDRSPSLKRSRLQETGGWNW